MSSNKCDLVNVVSRGRLVEGHNVAQVIGQLQRQFKINEKQATRLLKTGFVLKKNVAITKAKRWCQNLHRLGLVAGIRPTTVAASATLPDSVNEAHKLERIDKQTIDKIFNCDIPRAPVNIAYKFGLIATAMLSLLVPTLYIGLIMSMLVGLYVYLGNLSQWIGEVSGGIFKLLLIVVPPFVAGVLILFISKPLFTRRQRWRGFQLKRNQAPALFYLVETMCQYMKVPMPISINVDNCVNASAGSAHGLMALLRGKLVLTIGLPLVAGMNARQLVGILAHEFGHFAQPSAMITQYLINSVSHWFADRAFYSDPWDERLTNWENGSKHLGWVLIAVKLAQWGISITRLLFKLLYFMNLRVTSYMSRQMEYDADRYEALIAGSDHFRMSALQLRILFEANKIVAHSNLLAWDQNKLLKNIPDAIAQQSFQFNKKKVQQINSDMAVQDSNWWDSHPPDNDRVNHAQEFGYQAIFQAEFPAKQFFNDFTDLCHAVTLYDYRANGLQQAEKFIVENEQVLEVKQTKEKTNQVLSRYFNDTFSSRPMCLAKPTTELENLNLTANINWLRQQIVKYQENQQTYHQLEQRYFTMALGDCLIQSGLEINAEKFHFTSLEFKQVEQIKTTEFTRLNKICAELEFVDAMFFQRMLLAVKTMTLDKQQRSTKLLKVLQAIFQLKQPWDNLIYVMYILESLLAYEQKETMEKLKLTIEKQSKFCIHNLELLLAATDKIPDLVDASQGKMLKDFILSWTGDLPVDLNKLAVRNLADVCNKTLNALQYQYVWLFGELAVLCEAQEQTLGMDAIKLVNVSD